MSISMDSFFSGLVLLRFLKRAALLLSAMLEWFLLPCYDSRPSSSSFFSQEDGGGGKGAEARARHRAAAQAVRAALRTSTYGELTTSEDAAAATTTTCAVCLGEVLRQDRVRELRNCRHVFHQGCLDRWLDHDERLSCPLCRAQLITRRTGTEPPAPPPAEPSWAVDRLLYLFGDDLLVPPHSS